MQLDKRSATPPAAQLYKLHDRPADHRPRASTHTDGPEACGTIVEREAVCREDHPDAALHQRASCCLRRRWRHLAWSRAAGRECCRTLAAELVCWLSEINMANFQSYAGDSVIICMPCTYATSDFDLIVSIDRTAMRLRLLPDAVASQRTGGQIAI